MKAKIIFCCLFFLFIYTTSAKCQEEIMLSFDKGLNFNSFNNNIKQPVYQEKKISKPKIYAGVGIQTSPLFGKRSNVNTGLAYNLSFNFYLTRTGTISILYKIIYWEGRSSIDAITYDGWGSSMCLKYSLVNSPEFIIAMYLGPYNVNSLLPVTINGYSFGVQAEFNILNNLNLGVDLNQLKAFLQENSNPNIGRYYPFVLTINIIYQF